MVFKSKALLQYAWIRINWINGWWWGYVIGNTRKWQSEIIGEDEGYGFVSVGFMVPLRLSR